MILVLQIIIFYESKYKVILILSNSLIPWLSNSLSLHNLPTDMYVAKTLNLRPDYVKNSILNCLPLSKQNYEDFFASRSIFITAPGPESRPKVAHTMVIKNTGPAFALYELYKRSSDEVRCPAVLQPLRSARRPYALYLHFCETLKLEVSSPQSHKAYSLMLCDILFKPLWPTTHIVSKVAYLGDYLRPSSLF